MYRGNTWYSTIAYETNYWSGKIGADSPETEVKMKLKWLRHVHRIDEE